MVTAREPVTYLLILTVATPQREETVTRTASVPAGVTRAELLERMRAELPPAMRGGSVRFFYAEPNETTGGGR